MSRWWSGHSHLGEVLLLRTSASQSYLTSGFSFCSGWLAALSTMNTKPLAVTIIMMVVAGFFTLCAGLSLFLLQRVSRAEPTVNTILTPEALRGPTPHPGLFSPQPPFLGTRLLPPNRGQLPAGSGRVLPGHLQQQNFPQRCLICCPRNLPGELVFLTLFPQPGLFCHLPSELHCLWVPYAVATPAQTWQEFVLSLLLPQQSAFSPTRGKERRGQGLFFLTHGKRKK